MQSSKFVAPVLWTRSVSPIDLSEIQEETMLSPSRVSMIKRMQMEPIFPDTPVFCQYLEDPDQEVLPRRRIGSQSREAEVYQIEYKGTQAALKIMPITSDKDLDKNESEIKIAIEASSLVIARKSVHFPLVHSVGRCNDVTFHVDSNFTQKARDYACMDRLRGEYPDHYKAITRLFKVERPLTEIVQKLRLDYGACSNQTVKADFLINELANEDLSAWGSREQTEEQWIKVIRQTIDGIYHLHTYMNICHNDLHMGNILLIMDSRSTVTVLIHDFGHAEALTQDNWSQDYKGFLDKIGKEDPTSKVPGIIREHSRRMLEFIESFQNNHLQEEELHNGLIESLQLS